VGLDGVVARAEYRLDSCAVERSRSLFFLGIAVNVAVLIAAIAVYGTNRSQLVLAQGSDSLLDILAGVVLLLTVRWARQPRDDNHPFGHQRAEPVGALVTAVLAGGLAFEVAQSSIGAMIAGEHLALAAPVAVFLAAKFAIKLALLLFAFRGANATGAAANALRVDTRNDVLACGSSLVGYGLSRLGYLWADAALALPVAFFIAYNGLDLARENLRYLMGEAPEQETLEDLERAAAAVDGVVAVQRLRAQHLGPRLQVDVTILVHEHSSAREAHDISVDVKQRLEADPLLLEAFVHVDTLGGKVHH